MMNTYCDQLRLTLEQCGLPVSPVVRRDEHAGLRFDAMDISENRVTFLWLGKPVAMMHRNEGNLVHMLGEMVLELH